LAVIVVVSDYGLRPNPTYPTLASVIKKPR